MSLTRSPRRYTERRPNQFFDGRVSPEDKHKLNTERRVVHPVKLAHKKGHMGTVSFAGQGPYSGYKFLSLNGNSLEFNGSAIIYVS